MTTQIYQDAIKRLTSENKILRGALASQSEEYAKEVRSLKAQLREGLSLELLTLRRELQRQRDRADAAEGRLSQLRKEKAL